MTNLRSFIPSSNMVREACCRPGWWAEETNPCPWMWRCGTYFQASSPWWPCSCERMGPLWKLQHFPQTPKSKCIWLGSSLRLMYLSVHWVPFPKSLLVPSPSNKHVLSSKSLHPMSFENHTWRNVTMFSGNVRPGSQWMSCRGGPRLKYPGKGNCHFCMGWITVFRQEFSIKIP